MLYPLAIGGVCIITSIIGTFFVKPRPDGDIMWALYKGVIVAAVLSIPAIWLVTDRVVGMATVLHGRRHVVHRHVAVLVLAGRPRHHRPDRVDHRVLHRHRLPSGARPWPRPRSPATAPTSSPASAMSMEATALPALLICAGIVICYVLAGLFGIAIATTAMLALAGIVVALDAYGPVTDNAGGIAEMAGLPQGSAQEHRRARRGRQHHQGGHQGLRHRLGRPRRAGAVRGLHLGPRRTSSRQGKLGIEGGRLLARANPYVVVGLLIGGLLAVPVRRHVDDRPSAAPPQSVVEEVRRQFREKPGIMDGTDQARITAAPSTC